MASLHDSTRRHSDDESIDENTNCSFRVPTTCIARLFSFTKSPEKTQFEEFDFRNSICAERG